MDADVVAELGGQVVPLAAGAGAVDDPVERPALVDAGAAHRRGRVVDGQDARHRGPQVVRHVPDRRQALGLGGLRGRRLGGATAFKNGLAHANGIGNGARFLKAPLLT